MNKNKNSQKHIILISSLYFTGIIFLGFGIGIILGRECESVIISFGLALITVAFFLTKIFISDESY